MELCSSLGDAQGIGDFLVALAQREQAQHFLLARRKA
jgi:hypothetical protein